MIPRTKVQLEVHRLASSLSKIPKGAEEWITTRLFINVGYSNGKHVWCSDCGHTFSMKDGAESMACPHCGKPLKITHSRKRSATMMEYFLVPSVKGDWQILRYYLVHKYSFKGMVSRYEISEVSQFWLKPDGTKVVRQVPKPMNSWWTEQPFCYRSELRLMKSESVQMCGDISTYQRGKIHPSYKKMGITTDFHKCEPPKLLQYIGTKPYWETLLKSGYHNALSFAVNSTGKFELIEPAVRICVRHNYRIENMDVYYDYIYAALKCNADIKNPVIACPEDLLTAHDSMVSRMHRIEERKELSEKMQYQKTFIEQKSKFFGIDITDGELHIVPLKSLKEFQHEGNILHHCVFKRAYYKEKDSLILSARIAGESIETIEVNLSSYKVVQCMGDHNRFTDKHDRILSLLKDNMNQIKRINHSNSNADTRRKTAG